ncbi:MAG TPA: WGR domain-containing protein [Rhodanobacteraceae bacterium]|nr:WGR domain-containing protein [Rhodanobacteraceae bacterium]
MRIFMQAKPAGEEQPRYYQVTLEQDLLGGWTLDREWGQPGGRISTRREIYLERDAALAAFEEVRDAQLKRGLRIMFCRGLEQHAR